MNEIATKVERVRGYLARHDLGGVVFSSRAGFSWLSGGRCNRIANSSPTGVAALFASAQGKVVCLCDQIESPRFATEELIGTGIEVVSYPWYDKLAAAAVVRQVLGDHAGGKIVVGDFPGGWGGVNLPVADGLDSLRFSLLDAEVARYRQGGALATAAMEKACRRVKPGMTEHQALAILAEETHATGLNAVVLLIASDERIEKYRHPIATDKKIEKRVMLVLCAEWGGLISNLTRFVSFGPESAEHARRQAAVVAVDVAVNKATEPGKTLGAIFGELESAYAKAGFADEWKLHHQGGTTGYSGRDHFAYPGHPFVVVSNQAFAWNPSITGVKSEDTMVLVSGKPEFVTQPGKDWPALEVDGIRRPDVLVVK